MHSWYVPLSFRQIIQSLTHTKMVPLGPAKGAGSITLPYLGTFVVGAGMVSSAKGKTLLTNLFYDVFKGPDAAAAVAAAKA